MSDFLMRRGIDVSFYQGDIDWRRVKSEGYSFAIVKVSQGSGAGDYEGVMFTDPRYSEYITGARAAGLDVGAYHFFTARNAQEATNEARFFTDALSSVRDKINYYCICDVESDRLSANKVALTDSVKIFCEAVAAAGFRPMIYTNEDWLAGRLRDVSGYPLWLAKFYRPDDPTSPANAPSEAKFPALRIWQWGAQSVGGVSAELCDCNFEVVPFVDFGAFPGTDNVPAPWAEAAVSRAVAAGILRGDERGLRLRSSVTREELAVILDRICEG